MTLHATDHATATDAYAHAEASGREPILLGRRHLTVTLADLDRLERSGAPFAHLVEHEGRLMTIPTGRDA